MVIIDFRKKLNPTQKRELEDIMRKDGLDESLEVTDESITFEVDSLVYSRESGFHMEKLIKLLKEVNSKNKISSFSSGITFGFRDI